MENAKRFSIVYAFGSNETKRKQNSSLGGTVYVSNRRKVKRINSLTYCALITYRNETHSTFKYSKILECMKVKVNNKYTRYKTQQQQMQTC